MYVVCIMQIRIENCITIGTKKNKDIFNGMQMTESGVQVHNNQHNYIHLYSKKWK